MKKESYIYALLCASFMVSTLPVHGMQKAQESFKRLKHCFSLDSDTKCTAMDKIKIARDIIGAMLAIIAAAKIVKAVKSKPFPDPSSEPVTELVESKFQPPPLEWLTPVKFNNKTWTMHRRDGNMITLQERGVPIPKKITIPEELIQYDYDEQKYYVPTEVYQEYHYRSQLLD